MDIVKIIERYGDITGPELDTLLSTEENIDVGTLLSMASEGSKAVVALATSMTSASWMNFTTPNSSIG